jgi:hypothetical protein
MEFNHQLESRMPEIGLFGSGGGALLKRRPYLISAQGFNQVSTLGSACHQATRPEGAQGRLGMAFSE